MSSRGGGIEGSREGGRHWCLHFLFRLLRKEEEGVIGVQQKEKCHQKHATRPPSPDIWSKELYIYKYPLPVVMEIIWMHPQKIKIEWQNHRRKRKPHRKRLHATYGTQRVRCWQLCTTVLERRSPPTSKRVTYFFFFHSVCGGCVLQHKVAIKKGLNVCVAVGS